MKNDAQECRNDLQKHRMTPRMTPRMKQKKETLYNAVFLNKIAKFVKKIYL